jgi:hypothetical protein
VLRRLEIAAEHDRRALTGLGLQREDLAATPYDRQSAASLRIGSGELRPRDHLGRKSDAAVLDGGEDPIAAHADFDFHRVVGSCVLDRVCECLAEGDEKVREVVVANPVFEGKLGDSIAYESRSMGLRCDLEVQHRFKSIHRRYRWFPYGSI